MCLHVNQRCLLGASSGDAPAVCHEEDQQAKLEPEEPNPAGLCGKRHPHLRRKSFCRLHVLFLRDPPAPLHGHGVRRRWGRKDGGQWLRTYRGDCSWKPVEPCLLSICSQKLIWTRRGQVCQSFNVFYDLFEPFFLMVLWFFLIFFLLLNIIDFLKPIVWWHKFKCTVWGGFTEILVD